MKILGIDEAGRGCVIGPLVVAGVVISDENWEKLTELGVRDSKRLSRSRRALLATQIERLAQRVIVLEIGPSELDENLTDIELRAMGQIIRESRAEQVYLDLPVGPLARDGFIQALRERALTPGPSHPHPSVPSPLRGRGEGVRGRMPEGRGEGLVAENKADAKYPVVSAASIIAKVYRDRAIEQLRREYGEFGWGYPAEPKTRAFLREFFARTGRFPDCARRKWRTLHRLTEDLRRGDHTWLIK
ncbi:MAG: ribonuclease HII [Candidatus Bipolaricaulia bacterium]